MQAGESFTFVPVLSTLATMRIAWSPGMNKPLSTKEKRAAIKLWKAGISFKPSWPSWRSPKVLWKEGLCALSKTFLKTDFLQPSQGVDKFSRFFLTLCWVWRGSCLALFDLLSLKKKLSRPLRHQSEKLVPYILAHYSNCNWPSNPYAKSESGAGLVLVWCLLTC